jgi:small subunit ribosomal protein S9
MIIPKSILIGGKRKTAIAKAKITEGTGKIVVNNKPYENLDFFKKLMIQEPVEITKKTLGHFNFDIKVNVKGSGQESQIHAARLSVARALVKFTDSQDLKKAFSKYDKNLLVADTRRKEANKPGDSKARRKRQKSFR